MQVRGPEQFCVWVDTFSVFSVVYLGVFLVFFLVRFCVFARVRTHYLQSYIYLFKIKYFYRKFALPHCRSFLRDDYSYVLADCIV